MSRPTCAKCGAGLPDRPAPEFLLHLTGTPLNSMMATVQFKRHINIQAENGTRYNFSSLETAQLNYSLIAAFLTQDRQMLSFRKQPEAVQFYAIYPELRP